MNPKSRFKEVSKETQIEIILEKVAKGEALERILSDKNIISVNTWYQWLKKDADLRDKLAEARILAAENYSDRLISIADRIESGDLDPKQGRSMADIIEKAYLMRKPRSIKLSGGLDVSFNNLDDARKIEILKHGLSSIE